jgi:hypothetical protein
MKPLPCLTMRALTNAFASGSVAECAEPGPSHFTAPLLTLLLP